MASYIVYGLYSLHQMEVCDTRSPPTSRPHLLRRRRRRTPSILPTRRCMCHEVALENVCNFTSRTRTHNPAARSPIMSTRKGNSTTTTRSCKVVWTVEADLTYDQLLYITGDSFSLGCWEPEMAISMTPSAEHTNLWQAEVKIPCGVNIKYNYFIKGDAWPTGDIMWRPGPEFSLSVPSHVKKDRKILVRDSWMQYHTQKLPTHTWDSWIEETCGPVQPLNLSPARAPHPYYVAEHSNAFSGLTDEDEVVKLNNAVKDEPYSTHEDTVSSIIMGSGFKDFSERAQPIEEPWLSVLSFLSTVSEDEFNSDDHHDQVTELLLPEDGSDLMKSEENVSTVILINSSICTMQRIAILEDGNLVELLLEPVKNNVQCDSIYLGVVSKLVPHMGGAFVNIGSSRPSLMDIKQSRKPFIFPPFCWGGKEKEVKEYTVDDENDLPEANFRNVPVHFTHDDFEENEIEDDFDVPEVYKQNFNGSVVDYSGVDGDSEEFLNGNGHYLESEALEGDASESHDDSLLSHLQDVIDSDDGCTDEKKWTQVQKGTKIVVQVVKEGLGTKGPTLTAYPKLRSRFWILLTRCERIGVSKKISGVERTRLRVIAKTLQPKGFGLTVRTVASGRSLEELHKDLDGLLLTWKDIMEHAKSAALAADEGVEGAIPVILHRAMGQTLSVVQDYFNEKVKSMVVDSQRTYHEVTNYLQEIAPDLCDRVELYNTRTPLFDEFNIEEEINNLLSKRVPLANGGSLVIEQTEALVSIDVNGGHGMFGQGNSQEKAVLDVNLAAAKQIARELRLRDIGGIIVVDFIDMIDDSNKRLVYEEVKKAVERDRSMVKVSELSRHGLMEITRKRVRPSVTFMISEPCACCQGTGRVEALETSFSKIEHEICGLLATMEKKANPENPKSWPRFVLMVDRFMCNYLTSGKRTRLAILSSSLKVWILLKVARGFTRGAFEVKPFADEKGNNKQRQVSISMLRPTEGVTVTSTQRKKVTIFPIKKWKSSRK